MKTKLLKKVRRRFVIDYFPHRVEGKRFRIIDLESDYSFFTAGEKHSHPTKEACLKALINVLRGIYGKYKRKYKQSQISTKVWYNPKSSK